LHNLRGKVKPFELKKLFQMVLFFCGITLKRAANPYQLRCKKNQIEAEEQTNQGNPNFQNKTKRQV